MDQLIDTQIRLIQKYQNQLLSDSKDIEEIAGISAALRVAIDGLATLTHSATYGEIVATERHECSPDVSD